MWRVIALRIIDAVPTLFLVLTLVFVAMRILPGDPALAVLGEHATAVQLAEFRRKVGLDLPIWDGPIAPQQLGGLRRRNTLKAVTRVEVDSQTRRGPGADESALLGTCAKVAQQHGANTAALPRWKHVCVTN